MYTEDRPVAPCLQGGAHEHYAQIRPLGEQISQDHQEEVRLQVSLVHLDSAGAQCM